MLDRIANQMRLFFALGLIALMACSTATAAGKPNMIFILADDLGYGELGCYGQTTIATPALDRMAKEGLRFTRFYAGATVCAPSRSVLMTGQHHGHTRVRGNAGAANPIAQALRAEDATVAKVLRQAGYRTALIGKWGLGDIGAAASGLPRKQGFDEFFGYLNQHHAHNHFPDFLWKNEERISLPNKVTAVGSPGGGYATEAKVYADHVGYFGDWMATAAELAGVPTPANCDSISFVPTLVGKPREQRQHDFLYWEFHEGGFKQAAIYQGRWKAIRSGDARAALALYDLQNDVGEKNNVAAEHVDLVKILDHYLQTARSESPDWQPRWVPKSKRP